MNDWAGLFLGVIALSAVIQCVFIVAAAQSLRRTGARVDDLCRWFDAEIRPALEDLRRGASSLRAISEAGRGQAMRIEALLSTTLESLEAAIERARSLVTKPIASFTELSAFWGGLRRGLETYRSSEPKRRNPLASPRRPEETDEHLFIG